MTKTGQFSIVQCTASGATQLVLCHYHCTKTYSMAVALTWKLCKYYHWQGCGDTQHHIMGIYPYYHSYCTFFHKFLHAIHCTIWLVIIHSHAALFSTTRSVPPFHHNIVLQDQIVFYVVPKCMTLVGCSYALYILCYWHSDFYLSAMLASC